MTVLEKGIEIGEVVVYELDTRLTRKTKVIQTGQDLSIGDVCEPGTDTTEKRQATTAANEVQSIVFGGTPTGGDFVLWIESRDGIMVPTGALNHNSSGATITTALNLACGVANGIVASGTTLPDQTITFTYSGTGYAGLPKAQIVADITGLTGGSPTAVESTTTQGHVSGGLADSVCLENLAPVDEVQTIVFGNEDTAPTGGTFTLSVLKRDGTVGTTTNLAWDATTAAISTALDVVTGNTADIVCTGSQLDWANSITTTFTFSGGDYAGRTHRLVAVDDALATGGTDIIQTIARTTTGKQREGVFLTAGPAIVDKDQLDYNSTTESVVDAALLALGIDAQSEPTYTVQST